MRAPGQLQDTFSRRFLFRTSVMFGVVAAVCAPAYSDEPTTISTTTTTARIWEGEELTSLLRAYMREQRSAYSGDERAGVAIAADALESFRIILLDPDQEHTHDNLKSRLILTATFDSRSGIEAETISGTFLSSGLDEGKSDFSVYAHFPIHWREADCDLRMFVIVEMKSDGTSRIELAPPPKPRPIESFKAPKKKEAPNDPKG